MFRVEIDREWCIECGKCVDACPSDVLRRGKNESPIVDRPHDCLGCPHCTEACPTNVIQPEPTEDEHRLRGGEPAVWVSQPYHVDAEKLCLARNALAEDGLALEIESPVKSWWLPGETYLLTVRPVKGVK
ncbi:MAG: NAD(P)H-quinone oxidoreductase subunit I, chloroplastic [Methanonatronarchaeales archaeon]|nr:NAD(P)H-quinone oxidoreductase subunit I, chloroplastic [Methanonatronarchaeales archaeon]